MQRLWLFNLRTFKCHKILCIDILILICFCHLTSVSFHLKQESQSFRFIYLRGNQNLKWREEIWMKTNLVPFTKRTFQQFNLNFFICNSYGQCEIQFKLWMMNKILGFQGFSLFLFWILITNNLLTVAGQRKWRGNWNWDL